MAGRGLKDPLVDKWERTTSFPALEAPANLQSGGIAFSQVRLRTTASRRFKSHVNATCLIWENIDGGEYEF